MKLSSILCLATSIHLVSAYVKLGFKKDKGDLNIFSRRREHLTKRDTFELAIHNAETYYYSNLKVGSKGDEVSVLVDTGSSDLWVMGSDVYCFEPYTYYKKRDEIFERQVKLPGEKGLVNKLDGHHKANGIPDEDPVPDLMSESAENGRPASDDWSALATWSDPDDLKTSTTALGAISGSFTPSSTSNATSTVYPFDRSYYDTDDYNTYYSNDYSDSYDSYYDYTDYYGGYTATGIAASCTQNGSFATAGSDSFQVNKTAPDFQILYADDTEADGVWGMDQVQIHNTTVKHLSFAVAERSSSTIGVMGIGLPELEGTNIYNSSVDHYTYENLPQRLKSEGIIKRNMYSVFLSQPETDGGTILFGAIDRAKIDGKLLVKPLVFTDEEDISDKPIRLAIEMDGIGIRNGSRTSRVALFQRGAGLDTGSTYSYFPYEFVDELLDSIPNSYWSSTYGAHTIDCDQTGFDVQFRFEDVNINVPIDDLIIKDVEGTTSCFLSILATTQRHFVLGDNFLRHAYVAFDLEGRSIGIAPLKKTTDEDIVVATDGIPDSREGENTDTHVDGDSDSESSGGRVEDGAIVNALVPPTLWLLVLGGMVALA